LSANQTVEVYRAKISQRFMFALSHASLLISHSGCQRSVPGLRLFRGWADAPAHHEPAQQGWSAAHRRQYRQAAGSAAPHWRVRRARRS